MTFEVAGSFMNINSDLPGGVLIAHTNIPTHGSETNRGGEEQVDIPTESEDFRTAELGLGLGPLALQGDLQS